MNFNFQKLFESKAAHRRKLAALPIVEKLRLLDAMRERALAIGGASVTEGGDNRQPGNMMEDVTPYLTDKARVTPVKPLDDPDFIGAEAAFRRASAKAIALDRAAGLEPIVSNPGDLPEEP